MLTVESIRRQFITLADFAADAEIAQTKLADIRRVASALEPFAEMGLVEFEQFLRQAFEYKTTGVLSTPTSAKKASSRKSVAKKKTDEDVRNQIAKLNDLYAVVHEDTIGRGAIEEMCDEIEKFNTDQVQAIARGFGMTFAKSTNKGALIKKIAKRLDDKKHTAEINVLIASGRSTS